MLCVALFVLVWHLESYCSIVLTPFLIIMTYELAHILPGFISAFIRGISKDNYSILVFFTAFVFLLLGFVCSAGFFRYRTSLPQRLLNKPIILKNEGEIFAAVASCSLFLILASFYLYQGLPSVTDALIGLVLGGDEGEAANFVAASRKEITKGHYFGGGYRGQGIVLSFIRIGWPFLVSMAFIVYWKTRKFKWLCITIGLFLLSFVFVAGDGTRAPFINTLIMYITLFSFMKKIKIRFLAVSFISLVGVAIMLSLYSTKMNFVMHADNPVSMATEKILDRITSGNSVNDVYAIEFVRDGTIKPRLGAIHLRDMKAVLPGISGGLPFSNELALLINPHGSVMTYASGTYITKPYVDFGISGVAVFFLIIGLLTGFSQTLILHKTIKDPFHLTIGAMLCYFTGLMVLNSLMSILASLVVFSFFCFLVSSTMKIHCILRHLSHKNAII